jgi:ATP-binding cassette subfamily B multidrug efflux pump
MAAVPSGPEEIILKGYDPHLTRKLVEFTKPYHLKLFLALFMMMLSAGASVAGPYLVKVALDSGLSVGSLLTLRNAVALYLLLALVQWGATYGRVNLMVQVGQSIIFDMRAQLFGHLQRLSLSFYSRYSVGRVITRVINDVGVVREFLTWAVLAVARDLFVLVGILAAMLVMDWRLSLLTFLVVPLMVLTTFAFRKQARENYRKVRSAISWVNSVLAENINGVRVVQAFSRQQLNYGYFKDTVNRNNLDTNLNAARIAAAYPSIIDFLGSVATALIIVFGGAAVLGAQVTPGVLVAFVLYISRFFEPIRDLSRRYDSFQSTMASSERIFGLLDTQVEVEDTPQAIELPELRGEVSFEHVYFNYSDDPTPVLEDIDLLVHPGQTVALVGETGAGKSTLVKLISRLHDPVSGCIRIDGYDLREVTQQSLRRQMGIVLQDPFLFNGSVVENIRFGRLLASDAEIISAATAVGAHDFISNLRQGYQTIVEEGGVLLSVGQRQLISFARALLANPRILILDEATSSVDTQTERTIQRALATLLEGRTSFVIAHRLSTVISADHIVVVQGGRIVEQGSHTELLARAGVYFQLYRIGFEE